LLRTPPSARAPGAGLMFVAVSLLLALHCVDTGPVVAALHHRDCSRRASACLRLRGGSNRGRADGAGQSIFGMSSGEDDSSDVAVPLDDLALSESDDPDLRDPLQTVRAPGEALRASVTCGVCLDPVCILHAAFCVATLSVAHAGAGGRCSGRQVFRHRGDPHAPSLPPRNCRTPLIEPGPQTHTPPIPTGFHPESSTLVHFSPSPTISTPAIS